MAPPNQKTPDVLQAAPTTQPQTVPATPEQVEASARGQTRTGLAETKSENKLSPEDAKRLRDQESWRNNSPFIYIPMTEAKVRKTIKEGVAKELTESPAKDILQKAGFIGSENLTTIQTLMEKIVNEYYLKNKIDEDKTKNYLRGELLPKISAFVDAIDNLFIANKEKFQTIQGCMEQFGAYCGIDFIKSGALNPTSLETLMMLTKPTLDKLTAGYITEVNEQNAEKIDANTDATQLSLQVKLNSALVIVIGPDLSTQEQQIKDQIGANLPATLNPQSKETYLTWALQQLKEKSPNAGETREISKEGVWSDPLTPEQIKEKTQATVVPPPPSDVTPQGQEIEEEEYTTGIEFIDSILALAKAISPGLHIKISDLLKGFFPPSTPEFPGLNLAEKSNAKGFNLAAKRLSLEPATLKTLYQSPDNFKKILTKKNNEKLEWPEYMKKYLTNVEIEILKKKNYPDTDSAEKITALFLSENLDYIPPQPATPIAATEQTPTAPATPTSQPTPAAPEATPIAQNTPPAATPSTPAITPPTPTAAPSAPSTPPPTSTPA